MPKKKHSKIRILIADDHAVVREGLKRIIEANSDMVVIQEASHGQETMNIIRKRNLDVVVLDITLPGISGVEILKMVKSEGIKLPILILSMHSEEQYAIRVLKAGAAGYLTKESAPEQLVKAIRKVHNSGKYITPSLAERLAFLLEGDRGKLPHETLSDREYQVLRLIALGKSLKEIAEHLTLSAKTISTYRARILEKMKMENNAQLVHYALREGLVD
ncbi:response regulator transcription factor [candidate division KSB1 bacterium]|nr:response regulator transcription factor [candidate division KSB1 bacterium]NIR68877.1 response regulator transcription factor [candidate division KSB1 bacterium]NIS27245.1 response regulator transcription factor [candidate division KSB1 bacterium]NIT74130.1 response regulator transcription factor [candidate division KSB1 bacterium]NIU27979.1 response regulator transcription factor [candidate division KSB1 bacterium]